MTYIQTSGTQYAHTVLFEFHSTVVTTNRDHVWNPRKIEVALISPAVIGLKRIAGA
ncbi:MAG: hypothetical protein WCH75_31330 [Candidatus Binatia bacterium]